MMMMMMVRMMVVRMMMMMMMMVTRGSRRSRGAQGVQGWSRVGANGVHEPQAPPGEEATMMTMMKGEEDGEGGRDSGDACATRHGALLLQRSSVGLRGSPGLAFGSMQGVDLVFGGQAGRGCEGGWSHVLCRARSRTPQLVPSVPYTILKPKGSQLEWIHTGSQRGLTKTCDKVSMACDIGTERLTIWHCNRRSVLNGSRFDIETERLASQQRRTVITAI